MKTTLFSILILGALGQSVAAEDGAYFGLGIAAVQNRTESDAAPLTLDVTDLGLALTAGYRFASVGNLTYGIEGNLDLMSGKTLEESNLGLMACTNVSPIWCEVNTTLRLRGTMAVDLSAGSRLTGSLGAVIVSGRAEDSPGLFVDAIGRGISVGVAWENPGSGLPLRIDLNYDKVKNDNTKYYNRTLDIIGLRVSYMF